VNHERVKEEIQLEGALVLECPDAVLKERLQNRGREDDHEEAITKRLEIFHKETKVVIDELEKQGDATIWPVNSNVPAEKVEEAAVGVLVSHLPELAEE